MHNLNLINMKISNPRSRRNLNIDRNANVLDVGCGDFPHPRANVCVDKFEDSNYHRGSDLKVLKNQKFVNASGEKLPFDDKSFDYVICCHVMEHVEDPQSFVNELARVGKRGYLEIPSLIGEFLVPKEAHKWVCLEVDNKIVVLDKEKIGLNHPNVDLGHLFLTHLRSQSIAYKLLLKTRPDILTVRYEWEENIDIIVNPEEDKYGKYFYNQWTEKELKELFPKRRLSVEMKDTIIALGNIFTTFIKSRFNKH